MPPPRRILCIGHSALDRIYRIEAFPPEPTKVRALEHVEAGGGMAANAAVAIARLGGKAELWSRIGDDAVGQSIKAGLKSERVDVRYVQAFEDARSSTSAVIVDDRGERLIVGQRDTGMPSSTEWLPLERVGEMHAVLGDVRWLEGIRAVFSRARQEGVPTILDADLGAREVLPEILALTDYAIFSRPALREYSSHPADAPDLGPALEHVLSLGPMHAGVTLGGLGYRWLEKNALGGHLTGHVPAPKVDVIDTTGAGDAFHGAFTLMLAEGHSTQLCATVAAEVAARKCSRLGSRVGLPRRADVKALADVK